MVFELSTTWGPEYPGQLLRTVLVDAEPTPLYADLHRTASETHDAIVALLWLCAAPADLLAAADPVRDRGYVMVDDLVHGFGGDTAAGAEPPRGHRAARTRSLSSRAWSSWCSPTSATPDLRAGVQTGELYEVNDWCPFDARLPDGADRRSSPRPPPSGRRSCTTRTHPALHAARQRSSARRGRRRGRRGGAQRADLRGVPRRGRARGVRGGGAGHRRWQHRHRGADPPGVPARLALERARAHPVEPADARRRARPALDVSAWSTPPPTLPSCCRFTPVTPSRCILRIDPPRWRRWRRYWRSDADELRAMMGEWDGGLGAAHARLQSGEPAVDDEATKQYDDLRACRPGTWCWSHPVVRDLLLWLGFATIQDPRRPGTGALPSAITSGRLKFGWDDSGGWSGARCQQRWCATWSTTVRRCWRRRRWRGSTPRRSARSAVELVSWRAHRRAPRGGVVSPPGVPAGHAHGCAATRSRRGADTWRPGLSVLRCTQRCGRTPRSPRRRGRCARLPEVSERPSGLRAQLEAFGGASRTPGTRGCCWSPSPVGSPLPGTGRWRDVQDPDGGTARAGRRTLVGRVGVGNMVRP